MVVDIYGHEITANRNLYILLSPNNSKMREYADKVGYAGALLVAFGIGGCSESQLEQTVQAQQGLPISGTPKGGRVVSPEAKIERELDLTSPESAYNAYVVAYNNQDFDTAEKVVSQAGTYPKLITNARRKGKVLDHKVISNVSILRKEENDDKKVVLYTSGTVEGEKRTSKVTMVYEGTDWKLFSSSR